MARRLELGEYCGSTVVRRRVHGFLLTENRFRPHHRIERHLHAFPHFTFVLEGGFTERYEGVELNCESGSIILVPANKEHSDMVWASGAHSFSVEVSRNVLTRLSECGFRFDAPIVVRSPGITAKARRLFGELHSRDPLAPVLIEGLALEILAELARNTSEDDSPPWLRQALKEAESEEPTSLESLARQLGMSENYLARRFREHTGQPYGQFIRSKRLDAACRDLRATSMSIALIAAKHGFFDQAHFTRCFKKAQAMTPLQYRSHMRNVQKAS